jgi:hypothetical protein
MKTLLRLAAVLGGLVAATADARAQAIPGQMTGRPLGGVSTPAFSPYLNLARGGNPAINYYGLVRPQVDFARAFDVLQGQLMAGQQAAESRAPGEMAATGHAVQFLNTGGFFLSAGGGPRATTIQASQFQGRQGIPAAPRR